MNDIYKMIQASIDAKQAMLRDEALLQSISAVADLIVEAFRKGRKVLWAGNGGSAADAQHMAGELVNKFCMDRPGLPSIALTTDSSVLTSIGNDFSFDRVFARQVEALGNAGDILIGISTSGNSKNLVEAARVCKEKGVVTVAMVGSAPCEMDSWDYVLHLPSHETPRIQECQTLVGHILCYYVEKAIFGNA